MSGGKIVEILRTVKPYFLSVQQKDYLDICADNLNDQIAGELVIRICPSVVSHQQKSAKTTLRQKTLCVKASCIAEIEGVKCGEVLRGIVVPDSLKTIRQLTVTYVVSERYAHYRGIFLAQTKKGFEAKTYTSGDSEGLFDDTNLVSTKSVDVDPTDILTESARIVFMHHLSAHVFTPNLYPIELKFIDTNLEIRPISFRYENLDLISEKILENDKENEILACQYRYGHLTKWKTSGAAVTACKKPEEKIESEETKTDEKPNRVGSAKRPNTVERITSAKFRSPITDRYGRTSTVEVKESGRGTNDNQIPEENVADDSDTETKRETTETENSDSKTFEQAVIDKAEEIVKSSAVQKATPTETIATDVVKQEASSTEETPNEADVTQPTVPTKMSISTAANQEEISTGLQFDSVTACVADMISSLQEVEYADSTEAETAIAGCVEEMVSKLETVVDVKPSMSLELATYESEECSDNKRISVGVNKHPLANTSEVAATSNVNSSERIGFPFVNDSTDISKKIAEMEKLFIGNLTANFEFAASQYYKPNEYRGRRYPKYRKGSRWNRRKLVKRPQMTNLDKLFLLTTQIAAFCKQLEQLAQEVQSKKDLAAEMKKLEERDLLQTDANDIGFDKLFEDKTEKNPEESIKPPDSPKSFTESTRDLHELFDNPLKQTVGKVIETNFSDGQTKLLNEGSSNAILASHAWSQGETINTDSDVEIPDNESVYNLSNLFASESTQQSNTTADQSRQTNISDTEVPTVPDTLSQSPIPPPTLWIATMSELLEVKEPTGNSPIDQLQSIGNAIQIAASHENRTSPVPVASPIANDNHTTEGQFLFENPDDHSLLFVPGLTKQSTVTTDDRSLNPIQLNTEEATFNQSFPTETEKPETTSQTKESDTETPVPTVEETLNQTPIPSAIMWLANMAELLIVPDNSYPFDQLLNESVGSRISALHEHLSGCVTATLEAIDTKVATPYVNKPTEANLEKNRQPNSNRNFNENSAEEDDNTVVSVTNNLRNLFVDTKRVADDNESSPSLNSTVEFTPNDSGISDDGESQTSGGRKISQNLPSWETLEFLAERDARLLAPTISNNTSVVARKEVHKNISRKTLSNWYRHGDSNADFDDDLVTVVPHKNLQKNRRKKEKRRKAKQRKQQNNNGCCCSHCPGHKLQAVETRTTNTITQTPVVYENPKVHFMENFDSILATTRERVKAKTSVYVSKHPELKSQLMGYLIGVLQEEPENLHDFAAQHFAQS